MKILHKTLMTTALACPIVALPLINATQITTNNFVNEEIEAYHYGKQSTYTCSFMEDEHGKYARVWQIQQDVAVEEEFVVPATVKHNGYDYPVREINTNGRCGTEVRTIKHLNLSKATNLEIISSSAFDHSNIHLDWITFSGAKKLTTIQEKAFAGQHLNASGEHTNDALNLTNTNLKTIGVGAFDAACDSKDVCEIKCLILPQTINKIEHSAFYNPDSRSPKFNKIIFTSRNPNSNLFSNSAAVPAFVGSNPEAIVPHGSVDLYKKVSYLSSNYIYESSIDFDELTHPGEKGTLNLVGFKGQAGVDNKRWLPYNFTTQQIDRECSYFIAGGCDDKISINDRGQVKWSNDLPTGTYTFRVIARKYDDAEHKHCSCAVSESPVTLTILTSAELTGGSKWLYGTVNQAGADSKQWRVQVPESVVSKVTYTLSDDAPEGVIVTPSNNMATISWSNTIDEGDYRFVLNAEVTLVSGATFTRSQPIYLNISNSQLSYDMQIQDASGAEITNPIDISQWTEPKSIYVKATVKDIDGNRIAVTKPQFSDASLQGILISQVGEETEDHYKFDISADTFQEGETHFHLHTTFKSDNKTYQLVSNTITILNNKKFGTISSDVPSEIQIGKNVAGEYSFNVLGVGSTDKITNVEIEKSPYSEIKGSVNVTHTDKAVTITWDKEFAAGNEGWPRLCDVVMRVGLRNESQAYDQSLSFSTTFVIYNDGQLVYDHIQILAGYADSTSAVTYEPIRFDVNGGKPVTPTNIHFGLYIDQDEESNKYSDKIKMEQDKVDPTLANIQINNVQEDEKTLDGLDVTVYAYYDDLLVYDSMYFKLYIGHVLHINGLPEEITVQRGVSQDLGPVWTIWDGKDEANPVYGIQGELADGFAIEDGHLKWKGNTELQAGQYDISVKTIKFHEGKTYDDEQYISVTLQDQPTKKSNVGLIVGASVGGAVVVAGAATGITLGVKKHKANVKANNKK